MGKGGNIKTGGIPPPLSAYDLISGTFSGMHFQEQSGQAINCFREFDHPLPIELLH